MAVVLHSMEKTKFPKEWRCQESLEDSDISLEALNGKWVLEYIRTTSQNRQSHILVIHLSLIRVTVECQMHAVELCPN